MLMKNGKKKTHPILALGIGAMAVYGAYSVVSCAKDMCAEKAKMLTKVMKKKEKHHENCGCGDSCEC
jgi:hypothetical protein